MKKTNLNYLCSSCEHKFTQWVGQCLNCREWNTLVEEESIKVSSETSSTNEPKHIYEISNDTCKRFKSGIVEFDRVMGEGITQGSLNLIAGEPGIGKSTFMLSICAQLSNKCPDDEILYISGEESEQQIALRCKRLAISSNNVLLLNETSWQVICEKLKKIKPKFLILDSIQTTISNDVSSSSGTIAQIREVTHELMNITKSLDITSFVISHVTKDGIIAGPKVLEHIVDSVLYFEGDKQQDKRFLRSNKNRFGSTSEIGVFKMCDTGIISVNELNSFCLDEVSEGLFGTALTCTNEGTRTMLIEVQALVLENKFGNGRRTTTGIDSNHLSVLVAAIDKYFGIPLSFSDIYFNVSGGVKLRQRETDLCVVACLLSSFHKKPITKGTILLGEVGLTGVLRPTSKVESSLKNLERLGYKRVILNKASAEELQSKFKLNLIGISKVSELEEKIFS